MRKYIQDNSFFEKIDNEEKAYWLGFLYADGCVSESKNGTKSTIIELHSKDTEHLNSFIKSLKSNREVRVNNRGYVRLAIGSIKIANDLINLGCTPRKSNTLKFPNEDIVPQYLLRHFIRGYLDGDGCISTGVKIKKNTGYEYLICEIKFIGTYDMLYGIKEFFNSEKKVLINKHSPTSCQISFAGRKYRDIVESLYEDATIYLKRKKEKWNEYVTYMKCIDIKKNTKLNRYNINENKKDYINEKNNKTTKEKIISTPKLKIEKKKVFIDTSKDKYIRKKENLSEIGQYDLNGTIIKVWDSPKMAADYYNTTAKAIRKVCNGERKTCCNFIWKYTYSKIGKQAKLVKQYDINGNFIREWSSCKDAAKFYNVTFQAIQRAISGKYKTCCGFVWRHD